MPGKIQTSIRYLLFASALFLLLYFSISLFTAPASALTVSPIRLELSGEPGDTVFGNFKMFNETTEDKKYYIVFRTFAAKDETGEPDFPQEQDEFINWIVTSPEVTIPGKDYKELTFKVNIPKNAEPGAHFAAIFASSVPVSTEAGDSTVKVTGDVGTLILFRVNGEIKRGANILEFDTKDKKGTFTELPIWFYYRFQNGSQDYVKPLGDIIIKNTFGTISKVIPANKDKSNILPGSIRKFETAWWEGSGAKNQNPEFKPYPEPETFWDHVIHQWNNFAFGKYTAQLNLAYGKSSDESAASSISFWVVPWHFLLVVGVSLTIFFGGIIIIAILIALLFIKLHSKKGKKTQKKKNKTQEPPDKGSS